MPVPVVKWAGGKRQLLKYIHEMMPERYGNYYEPFIGGGAVLFDLMPEHAYISDINEALICMYQTIRNQPEELMDILHQYDLRIQAADAKDEQKAIYYEIREEYNEKLQAHTYDAQTAALLIFLNKHCFNGLYRTNRHGGFNVPFANTTRDSFAADNLRAVSDYLQSVEIDCADFEMLCNRAQAGDFVFLDSPYAPLKDDTFTSYTKEGFEKDDHIRLAAQFRAMDERGVQCMLTNHNTDFIRGLYDGYHIRTVQVKRLINRNANDRTGEEVIITNYDVNYDA